MAFRTAICHICGYSEDEVPKMLYFPRGLQKSKLWQENMGIPYVGDSMHNYRICSRHFSTDSYRHPLTYKLNRNAMPTLFPMSVALRPVVDACATLLSSNIDNVEMEADHDSNNLHVDVNADYNVSNKIVESISEPPKLTTTAQLLTEEKAKLTMELMQNINSIQSLEEVDAVRQIIAPIRLTLDSLRLREKSTPLRQPLDALHNKKITSQRPIFVTKKTKNCRKGLLKPSPTEPDKLLLSNKNNMLLIE